MTCQGCGLTIEGPRGIDIHGREKPYHACQADCVGLLRVENSKLRLDFELWRKQASVDHAEADKLRAEAALYKKVSDEDDETIERLEKERDAALLQLSEANKMLAVIVDAGTLEDCGKLGEHWTVQILTFLKGSPLTEKPKDAVMRPADGSAPVSPHNTGSAAAEVIDKRLDPAPIYVFPDLCPGCGSRFHPGDCKTR